VLARTPPAAQPPRASTAASASDVAASKGQVLQRSASEIRRAYGRPAQERAAAPAGAARAQAGVQGAKEVMHDNVARLHARGERLQDLEAKMGDFVGDAEGFAAMAKQLELRAPQPWWKRF
jgi:Synaptobrevin